jgi:hypothetical protein
MFCVEGADIPNKKAGINRLFLVIGYGLGKDA